MVKLKIATNLKISQNVHQILQPKRTLVPLVHLFQVSSITLPAIKNKKKLYLIHFHNTLNLGIHLGLGLCFRSILSKSNFVLVYGGLAIDIKNSGDPC